MSVEAIVELAKPDASLPAAEQLDTIRQKLEPYIYHHLIETYSPTLNAFWASYQPPKEAPNAYVIVERRPHPNFAFILKNMAIAAPYMSVYIFCSEENLNFIKILLGSKINNYNIIVAFSGKASRTQGKIDYNNLLTDVNTYAQIKAEYILTMQMDCIIRRLIPPTIFRGTYWGSPWGWKPNLPGGGGSTVRNVAQMIELCRKYRPQPALQPMTETEDSWIAEKLAVEPEMNFPDLEFRRAHIMESMPAANPVILHQFWTFAYQYHELPPDVFLNYWKRLLTLEF